MKTAKVAHRNETFSGNKLASRCIAEEASLLQLIKIQASTRRNYENER
jgi:hypothetical protein